MKKIIYLFIALICLCSCEKHDAPQLVKFCVEPAEGITDDMVFRLFISAPKLDTKEELEFYFHGSFEEVLGPYPLGKTITVDILDDASRRLTTPHHFVKIYTKESSSGTWMLRASFVNFATYTIPDPSRPD